MSELQQILGSIRDPGLVFACFGLVLYLNRDYTKKSDHEELKRSVEDMKKDYVSKEKLSDVLKPFSDQITAFGRELGEIKQIILEAWKK